MSALSNLWTKLAGSKEYRHALVAAELKRGLPRQIRVLRKQRKWSQADLARAAGLTQGAISRAEDPDYGNLTLNNLLKIAAGLDVAFVGRFVPFSDFARGHVSLTDESQLEVPQFTEEEETEELADGAAVAAPAGEARRVEPVVPRTRAAPGRTPRGATSKRTRRRPERLAAGVGVRTGPLARRR